jgi:hypothetical protein
MNCDELIKELPSRIHTKTNVELCDKFTLDLEQQQILQDYVFIKELITGNQRYLIHKTVGIPIIYRLIVYHLNYYTPKKYDMMRQGVIYKTENQMYEFLIAIYKN